LLIAYSAFITETIAYKFLPKRYKDLYCLYLSNTVLLHYIRLQIQCPTILLHRVVFIGSFSRIISFQQHRNYSWSVYCRI